MSRRTLLILAAAVGLAVVGALVGVVVATSGGGDRLTVFTARSHYGDEKPFETFAADEGIDLTLFGGSASELYERLKSEGDETKADVLITVDAANLWRAEEAGLLKPLRSAEARPQRAGLGARPEGEWYGLTLRARTIMRSTERVRPEDVTTYEGLGDPRWKGKLCLRSGTWEYNVSFVADRIAKDGEATTKRMLERWMANDPEILGSDTDVLKAIADGAATSASRTPTTSGRELEEDEDFPVAPVWADQQGRGTHVNLSGVGVVKASRPGGEARPARALPDGARPAAHVRPEQPRVRCRPRCRAPRRRSRGSGPSSATRSTCRAPASTSRTPCG